MTHRLDADTLAPLVERVAELAADPRNDRLRALWHEHNLGRRQLDFRPVFVNLRQGHYPHAWTEISELNDLCCTDPLAREVERQLRQVLWRRQHVPDDSPVEPVVVLHCRMPPEWRFDEMFGPPARQTRPAEDGGTLGAVHFDGCLDGAGDLQRLRPPRFAFDRQATREQAQRVTELVRGRLTVLVRHDHLGCNPFDWAMRLRGMERILYDFVDNPDFLQRLMAVVTDGHVEYHRRREQAGCVHFHADRQHIHAAYTHSPHDGPHRLSECWAYVSAQSAGVVSPEMYARFVHPYNCRLAELFGFVYYHGCEDLTRKAAIIARLPHLRRFHVSPWTNCAAVARTLPEDVTLEVTVNNTDHLFAFSDGQVCDDVRRLADAGGNHPFDMNLSDIETVGGDPSRLTRWVDLAREGLGTSGSA